MQKLRREKSDFLERVIAHGKYAVAIAGGLDQRVFVIAPLIAEHVFHEMPAAHGGGA